MVVSCSYGFGRHIETLTTDDKLMALKVSSIYYIASTTSHLMITLTPLVVLCRSDILQTHCESRQNIHTPTISPHICPKMVPQVLLYPHRHHCLLYVYSLSLIKLAVPSTQRRLGQVYPVNLH